MRILIGADSVRSSAERIRWEVDQFKEAARAIQSQEQFTPAYKAQQVAAVKAERRTAARGEAAAAVKVLAKYHIQAQVMQQEARAAARLDMTKNVGALSFLRDDFAATLSTAPRSTDPMWSSDNIIATIERLRSESEGDSIALRALRVAALPLISEYANTSTHPFSQKATALVNAFKADEAASFGPKFLEAESLRDDLNNAFGQLNLAIQAAGHELDGSTSWPSDFLNGLTQAETTEQLQVIADGGGTRESPAKPMASGSEVMWTRTPEAAAA